MTFTLFLLLGAYFCQRPAFTRKYNDTLLSCYICMELEYAHQQKCDENKPMFQTCVFTKDLLNWKAVEDKLDSQVTFKCLLLYYKDALSKDEKSLRGCVAEFKGYNVCEHSADFVEFDEELSCEVCDTRNCNVGLIDQNSSCDSSSNFYLILLLLIVYNVIY